MPEGAEVIDGERRHVLPAFVDPHVHLRVPGQEHKEDLETGTRAAAAGGFCAVVAMPNTEPVVDSAPILRALRDAAARDARVPVAFTASITKGLRGEELTEMAELRDEGAIAFTDDGKPDRLGRDDAQGAAVPAPGRRRCWRCTRRTPRSAAAGPCTRARSARCSASPASRA